MQLLVVPSPLTYRRRGIAADTNEVGSGRGRFDERTLLVIAVNRRVVSLASLLERIARNAIARNRKIRSPAVDRPVVTTRAPPRKRFTASDRLVVVDKLAATP